MNHTGSVRKLRAQLTETVQYKLPIGGDLVALNPLLGQELRLQFSGDIHCVNCGRKTNKSFNQGYCFPCMRSLAECDSCIIKPELCHYHAGTCREPSWGEQHCFTDHFIYLANTSGLKVGITRNTNIPTRWLDQGATQALPIMRVKNRLLSGQAEVIFKQYVADKTAWQRMLKGPAEQLDLGAERDKLFDQCRTQIHAAGATAGEDAVVLLDSEQPISITYPVLRYPQKVTSFNFDKSPSIAAKLEGIKGQYLIFDTGVLNVRKFAGYQLSLQV